MANEPGPAAAPLSRRQTLWLLLAALAAAAPLTPHFPAWLLAGAAAAFLIRAWILWRNAALPSRWMLTLSAFACAVGIHLQYRSLFGKDPGVALLIGFIALKLLEMRSARDALAAIFLAYFLVLGAFFYSQSMAAAAVAGGAVFIITTALVNLNHDRRPVAATLRTGGLLLLHALPFMLLLFVLFPRVSGPLWGLPSDAYSGLSGLSDTMSPGSISRLSLSDAIAFRVRFAGPPPPHPALYWRGPVLAQFDGRTWRGSQSGFVEGLPYAGAAKGIDYQVTLEADNQRWLYALELPTALPADAAMTADYQLLARAPVRSRLRYSASSQLGIVAGVRDSPVRLREALQLPPRGNPRARRLAEGLRVAAGSDAAVVTAMLSYFRNEPFYYTLEPPLLGSDSVDEFVFDSRRGFCEHYAASFVFVMRAAGIPARVVTGYQGGEVNPVDGFLQVRQSDAHAWAEVWLAGSGWHRVDPTAAIAPSRVEINLAAALPAGEPLPMLIRADWTWLRDLRYRWDALANGWNQWVLGYNPQRQVELLRSLGMSSPDWQSMTAVLAVACGLLMLALTGWALLQRQRSDPALAAWNRLSRKLRRRGLARRPWEGPRQYAARVGAALPRRADEVTALAVSYEDLRYAAGRGGITLQNFRRRVAAFSP
jgi:transglutaminase-like putative cysteine protease